MAPKAPSSETNTPSEETYRRKRSVDTAAITTNRRSKEAR